MITDLLNRMTVARSMIIGILVAALYYFVVFDSGMLQQSQIAAKNQRIQELQRQIVEDQKKLERALIYKQTAAEIGSTINKLLSLVPEKFGMSDLMRIVSNEAKVAGLSMAGVTPGSVRVSPVASEFEELTASIELQGSFLQHMVFLSNLTKINQILITKKIDFTHLKDNRGEEPPTVGMKAVIVAYRYRGNDGNASQGGQSQ